MELGQAHNIARGVAALLEPHCHRIAIAGSIRRQKPEVGDIEIVAIPKPYDVGLFESGIATVVNQWPKVKGELPCKYTQRQLPEIKLDLFFATPENWGSILLIRTGNWRFSKHFMGTLLPQHGMRQKDGFVWQGAIKVKTPEEEDMFRLVGMDFVHPCDRELAE